MDDTHPNTAYDVNIDEKQYRHPARPAVSPQVQTEIDRLARMADDELLEEIWRIRADYHLWYARIGDQASPLYAVVQVDLLFAEVLERWRRAICENKIERETE